MTPSFPTRRSSAPRPPILPSRRRRYAPVMPSRGLADVHPLLNRRRPQRVAVQDVGLSFVAPRHFAEDQAVPRRVAAVDEAVLYRIGPLDQMLEILETIFDPCDQIGRAHV